MDQGKLRLYCCRAALFAAAVCALWALWYLVRRRRAGPLTPGGFWLRFGMLFYLSALVQITVIRGADTLWDFWALPHVPLSALQLTPLHTIRWAWRIGGCYFTYQVLGNVAGFVPLGLLGPVLWPRLRRFWCALAAGALLSAAIEGCQWVFATGSTDIDDLLLNTAGAVLGWLCWAGISAFRRRKSRKK